MSSKTLSIFVLFSTLVVAGCGGGGGSSSGGGSIPSTGGGTSVTPTPTPAPSAAATSSPTSAPAPVVNSNAAPIALYDAADPSHSQIVGSPSPQTTSPYVALQPTAGGATFENMKCEVLAPSYSTHFHLHVSLIVNGQQIALPSAIGLINPVLLDGKYYWDDQSGNPNSCDYPTKTHEPDGVIHLATNAVGATYTLGQFLDVWNAAISTSGTAQGFAATGFGSFSGPTRIFLTDESTGSPGSYKVTELTGIEQHNAVYTLKDHQEYTIEVGPTFVNTPNYTFGPGLQ